MVDRVGRGRTLDFNWASHLLVAECFARQLVKPCARSHVQATRKQIAAKDIEFHQ